MKDYTIKFWFVNREGERQENAITVKAGDKSEATQTAMRQLKSLHSIHIVRENIVSISVLA